VGWTGSPPKLVTKLMFPLLLGNDFVIQFSGLPVRSTKLRFIYEKYKLHKIILFVGKFFKFKHKI